MKIITPIFFITLLFQVGCSRVTPQQEKKTELLSCEERAEPKSLQYLEQQYRCASTPIKE